MSYEVGEVLAKGGHRCALPRAAILRPLSLVSALFNFFNHRVRLLGSVGLSSSAGLRLLPLPAPPSLSA